MSPPRALNAALLVPLLALLAACGDASSDTPAPTPTVFTLTFTNASAPGDLTTGQGPADITFAPGLWALHDGDAQIATPGEAASPGLESLAEDGAPTALQESTRQQEAVAEAKIFATLTEVTYDAAPIAPGQSVAFDVQALPGQRLFIATMFAESNDVFLAALDLPLFDDQGEPLTGDRTDQLRLYDAGTEVNEPPGDGDFQPATQPDLDTGEDEGGVVTEIDGQDAQGFSYPAVSDMAALTVEVQ